MNVAVIGIGNMGRNHVRVYSELPHVHISAICDVNETVGIKLAKHYHTKYYKNFLEMIDKESLDAISICVPTTLHFTIAKACIERNFNVLLEKPITNSITQATQLLRLAKKHNTVFMIGHIERFNPAVIKVKELIDGRNLGEIIAIISRRIGGFPPQIDTDIGVDLAIHDIDIVNYLMGKHPKEIVVNKQKHHIKERDDTVEFFLKYKKASAYIQANWISPVKVRRLTITGTEGYLEMDYITQTIDFYKSNYSKFKEASKGFSNYMLLFSEPDKVNITVSKKEPLKEELSYFIHCAQNNVQINSQYAIDALKIALSSN